jgi:hypothetical protein
MNKNIKELQLLRAFGILVVMIHHMHYNLFNWSSDRLETFYTYFSGTAALDMFFVLSGFVIFRLLFNDLGKAEDRFHSIQLICVFWLRRAWRLLPAAWLWLGLLGGELLLRTQFSLLEPVTGRTVLYFPATADDLQRQVVATHFTGDNRDPDVCSHSDLSRQLQAAGLPAGRSAGYLVTQPHLPCFRTGLSQRQKVVALGGPVCTAGLDVRNERQNRTAVHAIPAVSPVRGVPGLHGIL